MNLWFGGIDESQLREAARRAGGIYTSGLGLQPPALGGEGLDRIDLVLTASGLDSFETEFAGAREYELDGVPVKVLPLERIIVSKRAAKRAKDSAQIPMLEAALAARRARNENDEIALTAASCERRRLTAHNPDNRLDLLPHPSPGTVPKGVERSG